MDNFEKKEIEAGAESPISASAPASSHSSHPEHDHASSEQASIHICNCKSSSTRSVLFYPPIVPCNRRRGLLARYAMVPETTQPRLYPRRTKWMITFTIAVASAAAPMGSAIIMPCLLDISREFHASPTITNLGVALYMLSMSIFPLWWSSFSETLGRRTIYVVSFVLFMAWAIGGALSTNIGMLITMRLLSGGAAASVQAVGAGTIADIWEPKERGRAMGFFYLGPLCGPLFAPIIGGALAQGLGWRSTQWFLVIYGAIAFLLLVFVLPETLRPRAKVVNKVKRDGDTKLQVGGPGSGTVNDEKGTENQSGKDTERVEESLRRSSTRQSIAQKSGKKIKVLKRCFIDPLKIILLLRFPAVAITVYWASITFGSLYFLNISIETTFAKSPYNFPTIIVGLLYIPNSLGYFLASVTGGRWLDHIMKREAKRKGRIDANGNLIYKPEDRMRENAWIAGMTFPAALIWYGWTAEKGVIWIVPMIANFFFGLGSMIVFAMATTMLTEFMPRRASTGIAVNNFMRNIFSCVGSIVADPLIKAIGNGWLCTILGIVALISGCVVICAMRKFGEKWREDMDRELVD